MPTATPNATLNTNPTLTQAAGTESELVQLQREEKAATTPNSILTTNPTLTQAASKESELVQLHREEEAVTAKEEGEALLGDTQS